MAMTMTMTKLRGYESLFDVCFLSNFFYSRILWYRSRVLVLHSALWHSSSPVASFCWPSLFWVYLSGADMWQWPDAELRQQVIPCYWPLRSRCTLPACRWMAMKTQHTNTSKPRLLFKHCCWLFRPSKLFLHWRLFCSKFEAERCM